MDFEQIKTIKGGQRQYGRKPQTCAKVLVNQSCRYCGSNHPPKRCLTYGKNCMECSKINCFMKVCRSGINRTFHNLEQEPDQHHEGVDYINMGNVNSVYFNNKYSVITINLKTFSNQASIVVPYKVDTCSNGNIMPLQYIRLFQLFPSAKKSN